MSQWVGMDSSTSRSGWPQGQQSQQQSAKARFLDARSTESEEKKQRITAKLKLVRSSRARGEGAPSNNALETRDREEKGKQCLDGVPSKKVRLYYYAALRSPSHDTRPKKA